MSAIFTMFSTLLHKQRFLFRNFSTNLRHTFALFALFTLFYMKEMFFQIEIVVS